jgi:DNA-binding transcriptional regulator LsrR (DeoR family)
MNEPIILEGEFEPIGSSDEQIEWRRSKIIELASQGLSQREIAHVMKVSVGTVNGDLQFLRQRAKVNIQRFIEDELPHQHELAVTGLDKVIKESWKLFDKEQDSKAKLQALNVVSDAIMKKQAVLGDPSQIEKAIKIVAKLSKQARENEGNGSSEKDEHEDDTQKDLREAS